MEKTIEGIVSYYNSIVEGEFSVEELKGKYIPEYREGLNFLFGEELVTKVFGAPTFLEQAESLIFNLEKRNIDAGKKCEYIISLAYSITNACGMQLDGDNPIAEKYGMIHTAIPIEIYQINAREIIDFSSFVEIKATVSAVFLNKMLTRIRLEKEYPLAADIRHLYEQIFDVSKTSLIKIFREVKKEIMGK